MDFKHPPSLPAYNHLHLMSHPCDKRRGDEEGRHGATPRHCYNKEKENGWPDTPTAERKTYLYSNALDERNTTEEKGGVGVLGTEKYVQRAPRRYGCQLAWSPTIASDRERCRRLVTRSSERIRRI